MSEIDLLHVIGDAPEGPWSVFSLPTGDGTEMVSVVIPRSLWVQITRQDPFTAEISLMEKVGRTAIERHLAHKYLPSTVLVEPRDIAQAQWGAQEPWYRVLQRCGQCHQLVPHGEVLEGLANALPPDSRGEIDVSVLCPVCQIQTEHRLTPWGIPQ